MSWDTTKHYQCRQTTIDNRRHVHVALEDGRQVFQHVVGVAHDQDVADDPSTLSSLVDAVLDHLVQGKAVLFSEKGIARHCKALALQGTRNARHWHCMALQERHWL